MRGSRSKCIAHGLEKSIIRQGASISSEKLNAPPRLSTTLSDHRPESRHLNPEQLRVLQLGLTQTSRS